MPLIYSAEVGAFVEAGTPRINMGGVFCDSIGRVYQDGAWRDVWPIKKYLYRSGDECMDVTDGWSDTTFGSNTKISSIRNTNSIEIKMTKTSVGNADCAIATKQKIDVSKYGYIFFDVDVLVLPSETYQTYLQVHLSKSSQELDYLHTISPSVKGRQVLKMKTSNISEKLFVVINASKAYRESTGSANPDMKIYNIWLEK